MDYHLDGMIKGMDIVNLESMLWVFKCKIFQSCFMFSFCVFVMSLMLVCIFFFFPLFFKLFVLYRGTWWAKVHEIVKDSD